MEENNIYLEFPSLPKNESLAKMLVAAFASQLNPTME